MLIGVIDTTAFMRQITKHTTLYTEMVVADAAIHGERDKLLGFRRI